MFSSYFLYIWYKLDLLMLLVDLLGSWVEIVAGWCLDKIGMKLDLEETEHWFFETMELPVIIMNSMKCMVVNMFFL